MRYSYDIVTTDDPRDPTGQHCLTVTYEVTSGAPPTFCPIYGGDPGFPPEYRLTQALNKRGRCVLDTLTTRQLGALEEAVHQEHVR